VKTLRRRRKAQVKPAKIGGSPDAVTAAPRVEPWRTWAALGSLEARGSHTCPRPRRWSPPRLDTSLQSLRVDSSTQGPSQIPAPCHWHCPAGLQAGRRRARRRRTRIKLRSPVRCRAQSEEVVALATRTRRRSGEGTPPPPSPRQLIARAPIPPHPPRRSGSKLKVSQSQQFPPSSTYGLSPSSTHQFLIWWRPYA